MANEKLKELIVYIASKSDCDKRFGRTKLNKLLFYSDFECYVKHGEPITGEEYFKLEHGPAPRRLKPALIALTNERAVEEIERDFYGRKQRVPVARREANLDLFKAREIAIVDQIIEECWGKTGTHLSNLSHRFKGWKLAEEGETIPYEIALVHLKKPTVDELKKTNKHLKAAKEAGRAIGRRP